MEAFGQTAGGEILQQQITTICNEEHGIPGATVVIVNREGIELFAYSDGKRCLGKTDAMNLSTIFWIASCTKIITGIALMQLVEQAKLDLDNADQLETICPELRDVKVLREDGSLEEKKRKITLRMLLTHTGTCLLSALSDSSHSRCEG